MVAASYTLTDSQREVYRQFAGLALPRHTSYPIAPVWKDDYLAGQFRADLRRAAEMERQFSLYVHIPFCEQLCYFCACTKEIVPAGKRRRLDPGIRLLEGLEAEAGHLRRVIGAGAVHQVHLGGGSPTFLSPAQLVQLWRTLDRHFCIAPQAEIAVEVDPRVTTKEHLSTLRDLGFNRISLGVQDFDPKVQQAVNRVQPFSLVEAFVAQCRELGFGSINFDLIYGLPYQTLDSMADALEKTIALAPDRIAFYRLAVIPDIFRWQNVFRRTDMPTGDLPLELNLLAINRFLAAGYEFVGLDHFAKPTEALVEARRAGTLRRNFQGMTTAKNLDILGLGPSAISQLDDAFAQNVKESAGWLEQVESDFAIARGLHLCVDDRLRRELLQQLYGFGRIDKLDLQQRFDVTFDEYFASELQRLDHLVDAGLATEENDAISLTEPLGRLLVRVVAAVFDKYLPADAYRTGLAENQSSKVG